MQTINFPQFTMKQNCSHLKIQTLHYGILCESAISIAVSYTSKYSKDSVGFFNVESTPELNSMIMLVLFIFIWYDSNWLLWFYITFCKCFSFIPSSTILYMLLLHLLSSTLFTNMHNKIDIRLCSERTFPVTSSFLFSFLCVCNLIISKQQ